MSCDLELEGRIATIRVLLEVRDANGTPVPGPLELVGDRGGSTRATRAGQTTVPRAAGEPDALEEADEREELRLELSRVVQDAFHEEDVHVQAIRFRPGSVEALILIGTVGRLVIDAGGFLGGLKAIRDAIPAPIRDYVQRLGGRAWTSGTRAELVDATVELESGALLARARTADADPAAGASSGVHDAAIVLAATAALLAVVAIVLWVVLS